MSKLFITAAIIAVTLSGAGCSTLKTIDMPMAQREVPTAKADIGRTEQQKILSDGYAQMYGAVSAMALIDEGLLVKKETDAVRAFGERSAREGKTMKGEIKAFADAATWINLDETNYPAIEKMKQEAVQNDRLKSFLPLVGRSQTNFERTLLLSQSGVLNQMQHLAQVMLTIETDPERRKFLISARDRFSTLYEADIDLLNSDYFCADLAEESKKFR